MLGEQVSSLVLVARVDPAKAYGMSSPAQSISSRILAPLQITYIYLTASYSPRTPSHSASPPHPLLPLPRLPLAPSVLGRHQSHHHNTPLVPHPRPRATSTAPPAHSHRGPQALSRGYTARSPPPRPPGPSRTPPLLLRLRWRRRARRSAYMAVGRRGWCATMSLVPSRRLARRRRLALLHRRRRLRH